MEALAALGDTTRRQIFEVLATHEHSVNDLVARFNVSQPAVSQHLKVLRESGLVRVRPVAQRRLYSANPSGLRPIELWLERTRRTIARQLDALERHLDESEPPPMTDLGRISDCYTIKFERKSRHSPERIWQAITDSAEVQQWMGYPCRIDLRPGGEWHMDFSPTGGGELAAVIVHLEQPALFSYVTGLSVIQWELRADGPGCAFTFTQSGLPNRGDGEEDLSAGWHEFLDRLEDHLDGNHPGYEDRVASWKQLRPAYRQQLDQVFAHSPVNA